MDSNQNSMQPQDLNVDMQKSSELFKGIIDKKKKAIKSVTSIVSKYGNNKVGEAEKLKAVKRRADGTRKMAMGNVKTEAGGISSGVGATLMGAAPGLRAAAAASAAIPFAGPAISTALNTAATISHNTGKKALNKGIEWTQKGSKQMLDGVKDMQAANQIEETGKDPGGSNDGDSGDSNIPTPIKPKIPDKFKMAKEFLLKNIKKIAIGVGIAAIVIMLIAMIVIGLFRRSQINRGKYVEGDESNVPYVIESQVINSLTIVCDSTGKFGYAFTDSEGNIVDLDTALDNALKTLSDNDCTALDDMGDNDEERKEILKKLIQAEIATQYPDLTASSSISTNPSGGGNQVFLQKAVEIKKKIADEQYIYTYGDPRNGNGICCASYVSWALFEAGYDCTESGVLINSATRLGKWCDKNGFQKVYEGKTLSVEEAGLQAGDIVIEGSNSGDGIEHVQIYAGKNSNGDNVWYNAGGDGARSDNDGTYNDGDPIGKQPGTDTTSNPYASDHYIVLVYRVPGGTSSGSTSSGNNSFLDIAVKCHEYIRTNGYHYAWGSTMPIYDQDYCDCSSFVTQCLIDAGYTELDGKPQLTVGNSTLETWAEENLTVIYNNISTENLSDLPNMQPGDIVTIGTSLSTGHTQIFYGYDSAGNAIWISGGSAGIAQEEGKDIQNDGEIVAGAITGVYRVPGGTSNTTGTVASASTSTNIIGGESKGDIQGGIKIQRKDENGTSKTLIYTDPDTFNNMISSNDSNVMNYYTLQSSSESGNTSSINGVKLEGSDVAEQIWNFFINDMGYSEYVAAGVLGNIMNEAGGNTLNIKTDLYDYLYHTHYGICQWETAGGANAEVKDADLATQLAYYKKWIETDEFDNYSGNYRSGFSYQEFLAMTNPGEAAVAFGTIMERFTSPYSEVGMTEGYQTRYNNALNAYATYAGNSSSSGGSSSSGKVVSGSGNNDFLNIAIECHAYLRENGYHYSIGRAIPIVKGESDKRIDCSSYVSWCLYEYGLYKESWQLTSNTTVSWGKANLQTIYEGKATNISDIPNIQPGDIIVQPGHTQIFYGYNSNGDATWLCCGGDEPTNGHPAIETMEGEEVQNNFSSQPILYVFRVPNTGRTTSLSNITSDDSSSSPGTITNGTEIQVPSGLGNIHTYMGWAMITATSSAQYKLREAAGEHYDSDGFAIINGRYVIACTSTFGEIGDYIDFYKEDGTVIHCIIGDEKSQKDSGCNEWGHKNGKNVVEFVVDKRTWYLPGTNRGNHANPGTATCHPEWDQNIVKAVRGGNYFEDPTFGGSSAVVTSLDNFLFIGDSRYDSTIEDKLESLGDNITAIGVGSSQPANWLDATANGSGFVAQGNSSSGENVTLPDSASGVSILLGTNALSQISEMEEVLNNLHKRYPAAPIFVNSVYHVGTAYTYADKDIFNTNVDTFNEAMRDFCNQNSWAYYVDINEDLDDGSGYLRSDYSSDGLHISSQEGIDKLISNIKNGILSAGATINSDGTMSSLKDGYQLVVANRKDVTTTVTNEYSHSHTYSVETSNGHTQTGLGQVSSTPSPEVVSSSTRTTYNKTSVDYQSALKNYTLYFDFLWAILINSSGDRDLVSSWADLAINGNVVITVYNDTSTSSSTSSIDRGITTHTQDASGPVVVYDVYNIKEVTATTTKTLNSKPAITEADTWLINYTNPADTYSEYKGKSKEKIIEKTDPNSKEDNIVKILQSDKTVLKELIKEEDIVDEMIEENEKVNFMIDIYSYVLQVANGKSPDQIKLSLDGLLDTSVFDLSNTEDVKTTKVLLYDSLNLSEEDIQNLYKAVEKICEPFGDNDDNTKRKKFVTSVILNRAMSSQFPDSVAEVLNKKYQFENYDPTILKDDITISDSTKEAVDTIIVAGDCAQHSVYFAKPSTAEKNKWDEQYTFTFNDGDETDNSFNYYTTDEVDTELKKYETTVNGGMTRPSLDAQKVIKWATQQVGKAEFENKHENKKMNSNDSSPAFIKSAYYEGGLEYISGDIQCPNEIEYNDDGTVDYSDIPETAVIVSDNGIASLYVGNGYVIEAGGSTIQKVPISESQGAGHFKGWGFAVSDQNKAREDLVVAIGGGNYAQGWTPADNVGNWAKHGAKSNGTGIQGYFTAGNRTYTVFAQGCGPWADVKINEPSIYISDAGCGITSVSIVLTGFGYDITPDVFAGTSSAGDIYVIQHLEEYGVKAKTLSGFSEAIEELKKRKPSYMSYIWTYRRQRLQWALCYIAWNR